MPLRLGVAGSVLAVAVSGLVALPAPTAAADEPVVTTTVDTITYIDPTLAGEDTATVEGTLRIVAVDRADGGDYRYSVETGDGETVRIEVADDLPTAAANGAIEAEVVDPDSSFPQLSEATVEPVVAAATTGAHRAYVVRVTGTGDLPSTSAVSTRIATNVLDEWAIESAGAIPGFTVADSADLSSTSCGFSGSAASALWTAGAARFPGVSFSGDTGNHLVMLVSEDTCGAQGLGLGTVGSSIASGGRTTVLWSADGTGVDAITDATAVHELGHNFGLGHANLKSCSSCVEDEYLDIYSVMGFGVSGSQPQALDTIYRDRLGLLEPGEVTTVDLPGGELEARQVVTLAPRGSLDGVRAARVVDPLTDRALWVEYRDGVGRDTSSAYSRGVSFQRSPYRFEPGVTITQESTTASAGDIELLPDESSGALAAGRTFDSATGGIEVRIESIGSGAATIEVTVRGGVPRILTSGAAGSARVGAIASTGVSDHWPTGTTFSHRWVAGGDQVSTAATYTPAADRRGDPLVLTVTAVPPSGAGSTRTSAPITIDYGNLVGPQVKTSGKAKVGSTLKKTPGTVTTSPSASYSYRWYRNSSPISGAVRTSYTLKSADRGKRIRLRVIASKAGYSPLTRYSSYVGPTK